VTISCIVATYGRQIWPNMAAERAIPSTLGQGFLEVIDSHQPDGTLAQARNMGASMATGEWLLFLDADDELAQGFGEEMILATTHTKPRPALFTPAVQYVRGKQRPKPTIWPRMDFKVGNWCVIGTLIERKLFHELGGFREYGLYEDYALWAMASVAGAEVFEVPEAIYIAHFQTRSRNRAPDKNEKLYWHQRIGRDVWPDHFAEIDPSEDANRRLTTNHLRFA
jgi:glycosyltransferase involved in cell wall biosynthesis